MVTKRDCWCKKFMVDCWCRKFTTPNAFAGMAREVASKLPEPEGAKCYLLCSTCKLRFPFEDHVCQRCSKENQMTEKNPQPTMPARMKIVSETTGFVSSRGPRGDCFEWYELRGGEWKPTHILHEENWLLPVPGFSFCTGVQAA